MTNQEIKNQINLDFHAIEYASRLGEDPEKLRVQYKDLAEYCTQYLLKDDLTIEQKKYVSTIKESCLFTLYFMELSPEARAKLDDLQDRSLGIYRRKKR